MCIKNPKQYAKSRERNRNRNTEINRERRIEKELKAEREDIILIELCHKHRIDTKMVRVRKKERQANGQID